MALDLVSWTRKTAELLFSPPLYYLPRLQSIDQRQHAIHIHLVMVHDHPVGEEELFGFFDWKIIQKQLRTLPLFRNQYLSFNITQYSLFEDERIALAVSHATKVHSSSFSISISISISLSDIKSSKTSFSTYSEPAHYLDADDLYLWFVILLSSFRSQTRFSHQIGLEWIDACCFRLHQLDLVPNYPKGVTIPVFLFDFSYVSILLLNKNDQVFSFPDMVIAVQNSDSQHRLDFVFALLSSFHLSCVSWGRFS